MLFLTQLISNRFALDTVLAPKLFNIYINDLLQALLSNNIVAYADGIAIISLDSSTAEATSHAENIIINIHSRAVINSVVLNIQNNQMMFFSTHTRNRSSSISPLAVGSTDSNYSVRKNSNYRR